ncbi:outer membrane protein assembly factor BamE [bacterium endosymbiont of Pedicinus badii]|uniref:outer membrane protein assembly factor BamE n=1 Tax=bacterium endosymbiont of Pedicinus badii TaxID=1719126 RepID=UPI0009BA8C3B|nr:outer membrane protein assembly factor BamE [bacterium endosymbiont of Pedicinus badii]OQM34501.1 hypothetical protein AOQ89_01275 [bacterium endosymbiont of Pedicinus badii]
MKKNTVCTIFLFCILTTFGCKNKKFFFHHPNTTQGYILENKIISAVKIGMQKDAVFSLIGDPVLKDVSNKNVFFYVFQKKINSSKKSVLMLEFNSSQILVRKKIIS